MHRLARALVRDDALAADVAQDALVAALEQRPATPTTGALRGWLRTVTRRFAVAARRAQAERRRREQHAARLEPGDADARAHEQLRLHRALGAAVEALPEPYRAAVALRYLDDLPPRAIARRLGVTAEVARQRVHRGLLLLRQRFDREHGGRAGWAGPLVAAFEVAGSKPLWIAIMTKKTFAAAALLAVSALGTAIALRDDPAPAPPTEVAAAPATAPGPDAGAGAGATTADEDSQRTEAGPAVAATLRVRVVRGDGAVVPAARVLRWRADGGESVDETTTDADGVATFEARVGRGGVLVAAPACAPWLERVATLQGLVQVTLPCRARVAGQLFVDGRATTPGVPLELVASAAADDDLPAAIAAARRAPVVAFPSADGRFAFAVHAHDWSGRLQLGWRPGAWHTHWLVPRPGQRQQDRDTLLLAAPDPELAVHLTQLPRVEGRVVWADDGAPVAAAEVIVQAAFADGTNAVSSVASTDAQGRFALGLRPGDNGDRWLDPTRRPALAEVSATARADGCEREATARVAAPERLGARLHLELPRAGAKVFVAVDERGAPIAGARAWTKAGPGPATGADGRGTFRGPTEELQVGAPGREVAMAPRAPAAGTTDDPVVFELAPAARVELHLHAPGGAEVPASLRLRVEAPEPLQPGPPFANDLYRAFGSTAWVISYNIHGNGVRFVVEHAAGRATLGSLLPGRACTLIVSDAAGAELERRDLVTPPRGEVATVDVALPELGAVRGLVLGDDGAPVPDATAAVLVSGSQMHVATTRADGTFALDGLDRRQEVALHVRRPGCAPVELRVQPDGAVHTITLLPGRAMAVRVVDTAGNPVEVDYLQVIDADRAAPLRVAADRDGGPGEFRYRDLPRRAVTFLCWLGKRRFAVTPASDATRAELVVPVPVRCAFAPAPDRFARPEHSWFAVRVTGLEPPMDPHIASVPTGDAEEEPDDLLLAPGRYRFELVRFDWNEARRAEDLVDLPAAVELDLRAGERTTVALH